MTMELKFLSLEINEWKKSVEWVVAAATTAAKKVLPIFEKKKTPRETFPEK